MLHVQCSNLARQSYAWTHPGCCYRAPSQSLPGRLCSTKIAFSPLKLSKSSRITSTVKPKRLGKKIDGHLDLGLETWVSGLDLYSLVLTAAWALCWHRAMRSTAWGVE